MRPARIIQILTPTLAGLLLSGCSTHTFISERPPCRHRDHAAHERSHGRQRPACDDGRGRRREHTPGVRADARWDVVLPAPEVAREQRRTDPSWRPEHSRNDESLSPREREPIDAVTSSWPERWRPDLDFDRTGRTSTDPERFIYSSRRAWWYAPRRGGPARWRWRR